MVFLALDYAVATWVTGRTAVVLVKPMTRGQKPQFSTVARYQRADQVALALIEHVAFTVPARPLQQIDAGLHQPGHGLALRRQRARKHQRFVYPVGLVDDAEGNIK